MHSKGPQTRTKEGLYWTCLHVPGQQPAEGSPMGSTQIPRQHPPGTYHIVHSLDVEVDTSNWNLWAHYYTKQTCNALCILNYKAVRSGEEELGHYVITQEEEMGIANLNLRGHTVDVLFSCNPFTCWITHPLTKINETLPYVIIILNL